MQEEEIKAKFKEIIAPLAQHIKRFELSETEIQAMSRHSFPTIMRAFRGTAKWIEKRAKDNVHVSRGAIMRSIVNSVNYSGTKTNIPLPAQPKGPTDQAIDELRLGFQAIVGDITSQPFTITTEEAHDLLLRSTSEQLIMAMNDTALWVRMQDAEPSDQEIVDQLMWLVAQAELVKV